MEAKEQQKSDEAGDLEGAAPEVAETSPAVAETASPKPEATETPSEEPSATETPAAPKPPHGIVHLIFSNKYLVIFVILIILAGVGIFIVTKTAQNQSNKPLKTGSLTAEELTSLKGNTTVVGDSQQVLDVQSNAVFQGQVLIRNNLDVAGTLRLSTPLTLSSLTVGGTSTLGETAVNNFSAAGSTTLQGDANLQRNLSVAGTASFSGAISAPKISVNNLVLSGDLLLPRHLTTTGGIPGRTTGPAVGNDGTSSVSGTDVAGTITINTGTGTAAGILTTVSFTQKFSSNPHIVVSPVGFGAATLDYYINRTSNGFSLHTANAPPINTNFSFDYIIVE